MSIVPKIIVGVLIFTTLLTVSASYYKSVVAHDFKVYGVNIELDENSSYVWFVFDNTEYEIDVPSNELDAILNSISEETGVPASQFDISFLEYIEYSYQEAFIVKEEKTGEDSTDISE